MKLSKRVLVTVTIFMVLPVVMTGYAANFTVDTSTLRVAVSGPAIVTPRASEADKLVFLPLASIGADGELEGRLAHNWHFDADRQVQTLQLRRDVRWHDGAPVTAHDVKFTLELLSHPDVREVMVESVTMVGDFTVVVRAPDSRYLTEVVIYPRHLLQHLHPKDFFAWDFWSHPVGNGPYRVVRHLPKTMLELKANDNYYRGQPQIERLVLKFVGGTGLTEILDAVGGRAGIERVAFKLGAGVPLLELISGNVDALERIGLADIPKLSADTRFRVYFEPTPRRAQIYWNHQDVLLRDRRVRRALTQAIDRRQLHRILYLPEDLPLTDGVYTESQFYRRQFDKPLPYDPEAAEATLREAGWHRRDDALLERDGEVFRFHILIPAQAGPMYSAAIFVQEQLRRMGVQMEIESLDAWDVQDRLQARDYQAAIHWADSGPRGDIEYLGRASSTGYANQLAVELLEQALAETERAPLEQLYAELSAIVRRDLPVTFLFPEVRASAAHCRVRGLRFSYHVNPLTHMEELWLEGHE